MHAFLVTGHDETARTAAIETLLSTHNILPHNRTILTIGEDETTIGIEPVRTWRAQIALAPRGGGKAAGLIIHANLLTQEAQQSLLKTIEEPPPSSIIILETATPLSLLPTILSRCQLISTGAATQKDTRDTRKKLDSARGLSAGHILALTDTIASDKQSAAQFIEDATLALQQQLTAPNRAQSSAHLRAALAARAQLAANVNPKMVLDGFLLCFAALQA